MSKKHPLSICEIVPSVNNHGRGLVCTAPNGIQPGQWILPAMRPEVMVPKHLQKQEQSSSSSSSSTQTKATLTCCCYFCLAELKAPNVLRCTGCKNVFYCSKECQAHDWTKGWHKLLCKKIAKFCVGSNNNNSCKSKNVLTSDMIALAKLVCLDIYSHEEVQKLAMLSVQAPQTKLNETTGMSYLDTVNAVIKLLEPTSSSSSSDDGPSKSLFTSSNFSLQRLLELQSKLWTNWFSVGYDEEAINYVGNGLFLTISSINHSCYPNALQIFYRDSTMAIKAIQPIACGDEITIAYISRVKSLSERKMQLKFHYGFLCDCVKCAFADDASLWLKSVVIPQAVALRKELENKSIKDESKYKDMQKLIEIIEKEFDFEIFPKSICKGKTSLPKPPRFGYSGRVTLNLPLPQELQVLESTLREMMTTNAQQIIYSQTPESVPQIKKNCLFSMAHLWIALRYMQGGREHSRDSVLDAAYLLSRLEPTGEEHFVVVQLIDAGIDAIKLYCGEHSLEYEKAKMEKVMYISMRSSDDTNESGLQAHHSFEFFRSSSSSSELIFDEEKVCSPKNDFFRTLRAIQPLTLENSKFKVKIDSVGCSGIYIGLISEACVANLDGSSHCCIVDMANKCCLSCYGSFFDGKYWENVRLSFHDDCTIEFDASSIKSTRQLNISIFIGESSSSSSTCSVFVDSLLACADLYPAVSLYGGAKVSFC